MPSGELVASIISIPCVIIVAITPILFQFWMHIHRKEFENEDKKFNKRFGTLFEGQKIQECWVNRNYKVLQTYKMLFSVLVLIYLETMPLLQILILL